MNLREQELLVCCFGVMGPIKANDRLIEAWLNSELGLNENAKLVFVGEDTSGGYGASLRRRVKGHPAGKRIEFSGFLSPTEFRDYLKATDVAVQLRQSTRGETSRAVLECLAYGLPTIINTHGSGKEIPETVAYRLDEDFIDQALKDALLKLIKDPGLRANLSTRAVDFIRRHHHPAQVALRFRDVIEEFFQESPTARRSRLVRELAAIPTDVQPSVADEEHTAACIAGNEPSSRLLELLVDVTVLAQVDARTGIQRVVRNILIQLLLSPPSGYRVEPVYWNGAAYLYARSFTLDFLGCENLHLEDEAIEPHRGDVFLGLDLVLLNLPERQGWLARFQFQGLKVFFVVYDLLPLQIPHAFPADTQSTFKPWLRFVSEQADGLVCISRAVAEALPDVLNCLLPERRADLPIGYFHLGGNFRDGAEAPGKSSSSNAPWGLLDGVPTFLMVGTLEPRKRHGQVLDAMEILWDQGVEANLVIMGKSGWNVDDMVKRLEAHSELGRRVLWINDADDDTLQSAYDHCAAVINASEGEGFGLPLVEAAHHGAPIISRDLPVFREVAGDHAFYFSGSGGDELAESLGAWLKLYQTDRAPRSEAIPRQTWAESAARLQNVVLNHEWHLKWCAPEDEDE